MANKLTLSDVQNIIDIHIEESRNFLMVVSRNLAIYISEYLDEEYDIVDENEDLDNDEFYVNLWFDEDGIRFYCESAKGNDHYKYVDPMDDFVDYFIFADTNMTEEDIDKYLIGGGTWSWCELVDGDNGEQIHDEDCECEECIEHRKMVYLAEAVTYMFRNKLCPECVFQMLQDIYDKAYADGYEECRFDMESDEEEIDEDKIINIHIDSLTINDSGNVEELFTQLKNLAKIGYV